MFLDRNDNLLISTWAFVSLQCYIQFKSSGTAVVCLHIKTPFTRISEVNKWDWDCDCKLKSFIRETNSLIGKKWPSGSNCSPDTTLFIAIYS